MPVNTGMVMEVKPSLSARGISSLDKLQMFWFGTASHYIQFGEISILTDPFVTSGLDNLRNAQSDPIEVEKTYGQLGQPPDAIFIGHSHSDHLLDAHTVMLKLPTWNRVKLYGSQSTKNILSGFGSASLNDRVELVDVSSSGTWVSIPISKQKRDQGYSIDYMALESAHTPHFSFSSELLGFTFSKTLLDDIVPEPLSQPPGVLDYKSGEVYNYLFRLRYGRTEFIVMMLGSPMPLDEYPDSLPPQDISIDIVIGLVANSENVIDYPKQQITRLMPRVMVLSHFNNFFEKEKNEILNINNHPLIDIKQYLLDIQEIAEDIPKFERVVVPAITEFREDQINNVIVIKSK